MSTDSRLDLSQLFTVTIDSEDTQDFDDAISLEEVDGKQYLWIHIADSSSHIKDKSILFKTLIRRATSIYCPDETIPMLPPSLSEGVLSLKEGLKRVAISFKFLLKDLEAIPLSIHSSVIKVTKDLGKLDLAVELKQEKFELVSSDGNYVLYNDGTLARNLEGILSDQKPLFVKIQTEAKLELKSDKLFFSKQVADALEKIQRNFPSNKSFEIDYFELPVTYPVQAQQSSEDEINDINQSPNSLGVLIPNEFVVHTKSAEKFNIKPFKVYFDASSDIEKAISNFSALALQLSPTQVANLAYIDMRFPDRSFTCQVGSQCAIPKVVTPVLEIEALESEQQATSQ